jgi:hypothetical protein
MTLNFIKEIFAAFACDYIRRTGMTPQEVEWFWKK